MVLSIHALAATISRSSLLKSFPIYSHARTECRKQLGRMHADRQKRLIWCYCLK